jgi:DNA-binding GntR family transcriptional regulator
MEVEQEIIRTVFAVAANETLTRFYDTLIMKLQWQTTWRQPIPNWEQSATEQRHMLHALKTRDGDLWALVADRHVRHRATLPLHGLGPNTSGAAPRLHGPGK